MKEYSFEDLDFIDDVAINMKDIQNPSVTSSLPSDEVKAMIQEGIFHLGSINNGEIIEMTFYQLPAIGEGIYLRYSMEPYSNFSFRYSNEGKTIIGFKSSAYRNQEFVVNGNRLVMTHEELGTMIFQPGHWISQFFWTEKKDVLGKQQIILYNLTWDEYDPAMYFLERAIVQENNFGQEPYLQFSGESNEENGQVLIDTIQLVTGDSFEFLKNKSDSFDIYPVELTNFFTSLPLNP